MAAIATGILGVVVGVLIANRYLGHASPGYFGAAVGVVQASLALILLVFLAVFSTKSLPVHRLQQGCRTFLRSTLPEVIAQARLPSKSQGRFLVTPLHVHVAEQTENSATYEVTTRGPANKKQSFCTHFYLNLDKCALFFYLPLQGAFEVDATGWEDAEGDVIHKLVLQRFNYEISLSKQRFSFDFDSVVEREEIGDGLYYVFCYTRTLSEQFVEKPSEQLALAQDISQLVRSFFMTIERYDIALGALPGPVGQRPKDASKAKSAGI